MNTRKSYVEKNLLKEERIILNIQMHWVIFLPSAASLFIGLIMWLIVFHSILYPSLFFLIAVVIFFSSLINRIFTEYAITNQRIIAKYGWLNIKSLEIPFRKIESIYIEQSFLGKIFDYGKIVVIGIGGTKDYLINIPSPFEYREYLLNEIGSK